ncbi:MAG: phosphodiesterase [Pseudomonadota bacterium]
MSGFIQITDTHIVPDGKLAYGRSDTAAALEKAVETINAALPRLRGVDCVIVTGDLTDHGAGEEYARFASIMEGLRLPWMAVPGNHDARAPMREAFADADWMPEAGPIHWMRDFGPFTLIALDTLLEGAHHGELCEDGFAFVDAQLTAIGSQFAVIATHHPWMASGVPSMDADNLRNGATLMERLDAHPGPVRMISGHVHRAATAQIGRVHCEIAPASCHAVNLDHTAMKAPALVLEPGAVTVYAWMTETGPGLTSSTMPIGEFPGPWAFSDE